MPEQMVVITNAAIPGSRALVTYEAYLNDHQYGGWTLAPDNEQPPVVYNLTSRMLAVPNGIATLNGSGLVVQGSAGGGGGGGFTEAQINTFIDAKIATLVASNQWLPSTTPAVLYVNDTIQIKQRSGHPTPIAGISQLYGLTSDGSVQLQLPTAARTQLGPGYYSPTIELAAEKPVNSLTLSDVVFCNLEPNATYDLQIIMGYESTVAASGERLRLAFTVPPGTTGFWGVAGLAVTQAAANGSSSYLPKQWDETFDVGGSGVGAGLSRWALIRGTVFTADHDPAPDTDAKFAFRARLSTLDGAGVPLVPAKIYGANTTDYDALRMTLARVA